MLFVFRHPEVICAIAFAKTRDEAWQALAKHYSSYREGWVFRKCPGKFKLVAELELPKEGE